ncbi:MAG: hypothetical protein KDI13_09480 [Alphaproteobacteria bacterium]|nr:hypothetical protein [Alphaproteobacteria bacterium]
MRRYAFLFVAVFAGLMLRASPALCLEGLHFTNKLGTGTTFLVSNFLRDQYNESIEHFQAAVYDLNDDSIDEVFLRGLNCFQDDRFCQYIILGEQDGKILLISRINARFIMLADTSTNGVRDLLVFKDRMNDYKEERFIWNSEVAQYVSLQKTQPEQDQKERL